MCSVKLSANNMPHSHVYWTASIVSTVVSAFEDFEDAFVKLLQIDKLNFISDSELKG